MPYISLDNLTRYDGKIKEYAEDNFASVEALNWQKTEKAGAVAFYPVPEAALEPVVDFLFTETGPASGEKGPDNPSTITGVSSVTVTHCETTGIDSTDYTVPLNGTFYGGSVDLSSGTMTVTKEYITISSVAVSDGIQNGAAVCRFWTGSNYPVVVSDGTETCDKLPYARSGSGVDRFFVGTNQNTSGQYPIYILLKTSHLDFSGAADPANPTSEEVRAAVNTYLASNPLHVVATRKEPATIQLTPTQIYSLSQLAPYAPRVNTVYSDQTSVQVGYPKSPQATALELTNAVISLGGNV